MSIQVHIERLILDGLPLEAAHGPAVHAAIEAELTRLLAERGLGAGFRQGGALAAVRGVDVHLPSAPRPELVGQQVGAAIYGSIQP